MSVEKVIYSKLSGDSDVSGLVSTRIYPVSLPQKPTYPAIVYTRISGDRLHSLGGASNLASPRFQIDCFASTYSAVKDLASKIRSAINGFRGTVSGVTVHGIFLESDNDIFEDDFNVYRVSSDYFIHYKEI
jgi:hypothetical protein